MARQLARVVNARTIKEREKQGDILLQGINTLAQTAYDNAPDQLVAEAQARKPPDHMFG